jgi:spore germination protein YaaH
MRKIATIISLLLILITGASFSALAANTKSKLSYGVWLPFWKAQPGQQDVALHLDSLDEISPFSYEVRSNGTLIDSLGIGTGDWFGWLQAVHDSRTKVIPTIAWFNGRGIHNLLSNGTKRRAEEDLIAALVKKENFDGIDIDFESMLAETKPYYSLFLQGLAMRLHPIGKKLACTVIPRMPISSMYDSDPLPEVKYTEDYVALNKYCDQVRIMAYDQGQIDIRLNASKGNGTLYAPTADPAWVEKVIKETLKTVSARKVMLGVPTYGYSYQVSWKAGATTYERVRSFSFFDAMDRADGMGIAPYRNNAGELSFVFATTTHINRVSPFLTAIVASALPNALAAPNQNATTTFFVSFSDAQSSGDKITLAKKYGLRGVMFFKADGQIDPATWELMN